MGKHRADSPKHDRHTTVAETRDALRDLGKPEYQGRHRAPETTASVSDPRDADRGRERS